MKALASLSHHWSRRLAPVIVVLVLLALPLLVYVAYTDTVVNWAALGRGTGANALAAAIDSPAILNDRIELASSVTGGKASSRLDLPGSNLASVITATESTTITYNINPPAPDGNNGWYRGTATVYWSWTGAILRTNAPSSAPCDPTSIPDQNATPVQCMGVATGPIKRDGSRPNPPKVVATKADNSPYVDGEWTKQNVSVRFEQQGDNGPSGIASCTSFPPIDKDQDAVVVGNCTDNAGNVSEDSSIRVRRDATGPVGVGNPTPAPNSYGWNKSPTNLLWSWNDKGIGTIDTTRCTSSSPVLIEGTNSYPAAGQTVVCYDTLGNFATPIPYTVKFDKTKPYWGTTNASSNGSPYYLGDWTKNPVAVNFTCKDDLSGPANAPAGVLAATVTVPVNKEGVNMSASATAEQCVDKAGNQAQTGSTYGNSYQGISIDWTKPLITHSLTPAPNIYGWNNTPVTVNFSCAETGDVQSGIVTNSVAGTVVSTEGANQLVTNSGTCVDRASNTAVPDSVKVNIDWTDPVITPLQPPGSNLIGCGTKPKFDAVDALSGVVGPPQVSDAVPTPLDDGTIVNRYFVTARDKADNEVTEHFDYVVYNTNDPFWLSPINANGTSLFNLGNTIPIKFELYDCNNQPVKDADARLKVVWLGPTLPQGPIPPQEPNPETKVGGADSGNRFRRTGEYYQFNWSTKGLWLGNYKLSVLIGSLPLRSVNIGLR